MSSAFQRPQRDNLSLKTIDIPGAMGKQAFPERRLVYQNKQMPQYPTGGYQSQTYKQEPSQERSNLDALSLQEELRHSQ